MLYCIQDCTIWQGSPYTLAADRQSILRGGRFSESGFQEGGRNLEPEGEGWLLLSDLAEHLELRARSELLTAFEQAGLVVIGKTDVRPTHPRVTDQSDPLRAARAAELTSLWRLGCVDEWVRWSRVARRC